MNTPIVKHDLLKDGDTLFLDNSTYELFTKCPTLFWHKRILLRTTREVRPPLLFGGSIHLAQKLRYLHGSGAVSQALQNKQFMVLDEAFKKNPNTVLGDHRTLAFAKKLIRDYNSYWGQEPFKTIALPDGRPLVEEPFTIPLGTVEGIKVIWTGRIDLGIEQDGKLWAFDHKTSSIGGEYVAADYHVASQFKGYPFALRQIYGDKYEIGGTIANIMVARKPAKSGRGKGNEFLRVKVDTDEDSLLEWQQNTLADIADMLYCNKRDYYPRHTAQCVTRYGKCEMFNVCSLPRAGRMPYLASKDFAEDTWSPLHEDDIDLQPYLEMSDDEALAYDALAEEADPNVRTGDILANLLGGGGMNV